MTINQILGRAILRSEKAYELYLTQKRYHQALRIYKANQKIYELLSQFLYECTEQYVESTLEYIFHLEDWFEQFKSLEKSSPDLNTIFVFERLEFGIAYPVKFKELIKK